MTRANLHERTLVNDDDKYSMSVLTFKRTRLSEGVLLFNAEHRAFEKKVA